MRTPKLIPAGAIALVAALAMAVPAAAASHVERWTDTETINNTYTCGAVEATTLTIDGTAFFAADGSWRKDVLQFSYDASYSDPATGETVTLDIHQTVIATPESVALNGQGTFIRAPIDGPLLLDVGRIVVDPADGSVTFASANVLRFDDPNGAALVDAAVCGLF